MKSNINIMVSSKGLSAEAAAYLLAMHSQFAVGTIKRHRGMLYRFYRWLSQKGMVFTDMTPDHLTQYHRWCHSDGIGADTCDVELNNARAYICWLIRNDHLVGNTTDFYRYSLKPAVLPQYTHLFLQHRSKASQYAPARYRQLMNLFHNWLMDYKLEVKTLTRENLLSFSRFLDGHGYTPKQLHVRHLHMRIYLDWLRDRDLTTVDCRDIFGNREQFRNFELPAFALEYIEELQTTLRDKTVLSYKTGFLNFHRFLHREGIDIRHLTRDHCVSWMKYISQKYALSTRFTRLVNLRGYFSWLIERNLLQTKNVKDLIRSSDFPKLDVPLPKPLPPNVDLEIQRRLAISDNMYHKGALLLRLTGMRLGELSNLSFDPVWRDDSGRTYIKVPIGKLHSERLVPIDEKTVELIKWIQQASLPHLRTFSPDPEKGKLLLGPKGGTALHNVYRCFKDITGDLAGAGSIHPHRLRHTFATVLMNADLDELIVMTLLGHKDLRMTARYSLITNGTVYRTFFKAMDQSQFKIDFKLPDMAPMLSDFDPCAAIDHVTKWLQRDQIPNDRKTILIVKRLNRLRSEIDRLK